MKILLDWRLQFRFHFLVKDIEEYGAEAESELNSHADWETVTQEDCDWNMLIEQLEDITFLDSALKWVLISEKKIVNFSFTKRIIFMSDFRHQPKQLPATLFCVPYDAPNVVLSSILRQGKGTRINKSFIPPRFRIVYMLFLFYRLDIGTSRQMDCQYGLKPRTPITK